MTASLDINSLRINGPRLWDSLMELAKIGATPKGGVCRLTLTALAGQARHLHGIARRPDADGAAQRRHASRRQADAGSGGGGAAPRAARLRHRWHSAGAAQ